MAKVDVPGEFPAFSENPLVAHEDALIMKRIVSFPLDLHCKDWRQL
jgi:hypothetical protein